MDIVAEHCWRITHIQQLWFSGQHVYFTPLPPWWKFTWWTCKRPFQVVKTWVKYLMKKRKKPQQTVLSNVSHRFQLMVRSSMSKITNFFCLPQLDKSGTFCMSSFLLKAFESPKWSWNLCLWDSFSDALPLYILHIFSYYNNENHELGINYLPVWCSENSSVYKNHSIRLEKPPK